MPTIVRQSDSPYRWKVGSVALSEVANKERHMPREFIDREGWHITAACRRYSCSPRQIYDWIESGRAQFV